MREHIENIHEGKKPYHCLICDSRFAAKRNFTAHVAVVHAARKFGDLGIQVGSPDYEDAGDVDAGDGECDGVDEVADGGGAVVAGVAIV